jgi:asparagine synthase (glutamine-hydrolysing)
MCGIAGVISATPLTEETRLAVRRMNSAMAHRGPDDEGYFFDEHVALAMRRLSIIDVAGGHQPIFGRDDTTVIVCNGEIYNFVELKREISASDYPFRTRSDVETILPLYDQLGTDCPKSLKGMFAFALWDCKRRRLLLARDRLGEKPLYLYRDPKGRLWFASEMKSLLAGLGATRLPLSPSSVHLFLVYQYVPEPRTMFEHVQKLPAGHMLEVTLDGLSRTASLPKSRPYWNYLDAPPRRGDPVSQVRAALEEASRVTLRSDVPVGIALSGGIDSSLVAAFARKFHSGELKAFSVGYPGRPANDERAAAQALARQLDMPFFDVELSDDAFVDIFPKLVHDMDDPIGDIAAYGYHAVSQLSREHGVPVLLSGIGADELFWGYEWVREAVKKSIAKRRRRLPSWLARMLEPHPDRAVFYDSLDWMRESAPLTTQVMTPEAASVIPKDLWASYFEARDWGDIPLWLMDVQNKTWLVSNCLALCDRVSMAHSVELRLPFLDFELVDLVTGLRRSGLEDWNRPHKWLLVEAIRDVLPEEVLERKKRGFTPPVGDWMRRVVDRYGSLVRAGSLVREGILAAGADAMLREAHPVGFAYRIVLLELWMRVLVDGNLPKELVGLGEVESFSQR